HLELCAAQVARQEWGPAAASFAEVLRLLPRIPEKAREFVPPIKAGLARGTPEAVAAFGPFNHTIKTREGTPTFGPEYDRIYGNGQDPADYLMREWTPAPPTFAAPALAPIEITWKDVTEEMGLARLVAPGLAPAAVGDLDLAPEAGAMDGTRAAP